MPLAGDFGLLRHAGKKGDVMLTNLIIQAIAGAIGANAAAATSENLTLGAVANTLVGAIGGGVGGQLLTTLLPNLLGNAANLDVGALASQAVGGGVSGAIVVAVIALIKNRMAA